MLKIRNLCKSFGKLNVLDGLDITIEEGELFGFVGPNGAGKTTTMKIIAGLLRADCGEIWIDGKELLKNARHLKETIGYMPDFFGVYNNLKVMEYMEFYASSYGIDGKKARNKSYELLELVGLLDRTEHYVDDLSRGMKQRLCLARCMIHDPKLLILDEPASGLDPRTRLEFREILKLLKEEGKTIIISSHILTELAEICTSIGVIEKGKMIMQGNMEDILTTVDASNPLVLQIYSGLDTAVKLLKENPFVKSLTIQNNSILLTYLGSREEEALLLRQLIQHDVLVFSFAREQSNLETLFLKITGGEGSEDML